MPRPAGEIRQAIRSGIAERGPLTLAQLRDLPPLRQATPRVVGSTVKNMVRGGQLVPAGRERQAHCTKWVAVYDLADVLDGSAGLDAGAAAEPGPMDQAFVDLGRVFGDWLRGGDWPARGGG